MKDSGNFRQLLGMKQEEMAMLLQIPLSQWAMYVTGKRGLPLSVRKKFAAMLGFVNQNKKQQPEIFVNITNQKHLLEQYIDNRIKENDKNQLLIKHKLSNIKNKYENATTAIQFINFLQTITETKTEKFQNLLDVIRQNNATEIEKNSILLQEQLQIKLELLQMEATLLQNKKSG